MAEFNPVPADSQPVAQTNQRPPLRWIEEIPQAVGQFVSKPYKGQAVEAQQAQTQTPAPAITPLVQAATNIVTGNTGTQPPTDQSLSLTDSGGRLPVPAQPPTEPDDALGGGGGNVPGMPGMMATQESTVQVTKGTPMPAQMQREVLSSYEDQIKQTDALAKELTDLNVQMENDPTFKAAIDGMSEANKEILKNDEDLPQTLKAITDLKKSYDLAMERSIGKVDPDQFWKQKDTGDRVLAGIAIFLGGVGAGPQGQNTALKIIDDAIARDINAQEFNIEQAKKEAAMWGERIKTEADFQDWKDRKKLESYAKYQMVIDSKLEEYKMRQMPIENKMRINELQQSTRQKLSEAKTAIWQMGVDKIVASTSTRMSPMAPKGRETLTPWGVAYDQDSAKAVRSASKVHMDAISTLEKMREYVKTVGTTAWDRADKGRAKQLATEWIGLQIGALQSGTLGESEYARYLGDSPLTPNFFDGLKNRDQALALIDQFEKRANESAISVAASYIPQNQVQFPQYMSDMQRQYQLRTKSGYTPTKIGGQ